MSTTLHSTAAEHAQLATDDVQAWLPRIAAAAEAARDADAAARLRHRQRNSLIVAAVDAGVSQRSVARAANVAQSRILRLLSESQAAEDAEDLSS